LVGDRIKLITNNGYSKIDYFDANMIFNSQFCEFTRDGSYMVIATNNTLWAYTVAKDN
jgi:hypothetical protein